MGSVRNVSGGNFRAPVLGVEYHLVASNIGAGAGAGRNGMFIHPF